MTATTYLRTIPARTNDADFAAGRVSLGCCEVVESDGSSRPATQDDIDACSQDWRKLAPGQWECHN